MRSFSSTPETITLRRRTPGDLFVRPKLRAEFVEDFAREKSDLPFVVVLVIEEAIAANAVPGDAFDLALFLERKLVRRAGRNGRNSCARAR